MVGFGALGELALGELPEEGISGAGGIASAEAFGTHLIASDDYAILAAGGIASAEAFGVALIQIDSILGAGDIASAEAFGTPSVILVIEPGGIASGEAFGTAAVYELIRYEPVSRV